MNESDTGKGIKQPEDQLLGEVPALPNTPSDLFWEMNKPGAAFEQNVVGIVVVRADGTIAYINPYFASLIGELPADLINKPSLDFVAEKDKAKIVEVVKDCISGKRRFVQFESTITHKNGSIVDIFANASTAVFEGQPAAIGVVIDITARKQMEAELHAGEAKYENALKMVDAADWEYDVLADRFTFNDNFYRLCRTTAEAVGGYTMSSADFVQRFMHPDDRGSIGAEMKAAIETTDPNYSLSSEHRVLYGDGTPGYVMVRLFIIKDEAGRTIECHGVYQDITKRKQMEMALAASQSKLQAALSNISQGLVMLDAEGRLVLFNPRFAEIFGMPPDQIRPGMTTPELMDISVSNSGVRDLDPEGTVAHVQKIIRDGEAGSFTVHLSDGRSIADTHRPMPGGGIVVTFEDITQRKVEEQALADSELKLQAALSNMTQGLVMLDAEGGLVLFNPRYAELFGMPPERILPGMTTPELMALATSITGVRDLDPEGTVARAQSVLRGAEGGSFVQKLSDGRSLTTTLRLMPDGGVVATFEDITQKMEAEQSLADSQSKLQAALSNMSQGLAMHDAEGGLVLFNRRFAEIYGLPPDQIQLGMTMPELMELVASISGVRDLDPEAAFAEVEKAFRGADEGIYVHRLSDGRSIAATYRPMPDGGLIVTFEDITQRKAEEQALADSELKLQTALTNMSQGLLMHDAEGRVTLFNRRFAEIFGLPQDKDLLGMTIPELMALGASTSGIRDVNPEGTLAEIEESGSGQQQGSYIHHMSDGRSIAATGRRMPQGGNVVTFDDITQKMEEEQALAASQLQLQSALTNMSQGLLMLDAEGRVVLFNSRVSEIYGLPPEQIKVGMTIPELLAKGPSTTGVRDVNPEATLAELGKAFRDPAGGTYIQRLTNGSSIAASFKPMPGGGIVVTIEDITAKLEAEEKIRHLAQYDALTNLPNRVTFYDQMDIILKHQRPGESVGVLSLDLDHFKAVNDTLGHPIGDMLLKAAARRMQSCLRGGDIAARLGGDEFAILLIPIEDPADITALATRLIEVVGAPFNLDGRQVIVGVSVGVAMAPEDGADPDTLMKNADLALYRAKADGGGVYRFFEAEMDAQMQARRVIELDLRRAMNSGNEFELLYQPIIDIKSGKVTSCEALVRWRHPERGLVMPTEFIPVAEATGLIVPLGEWVLQHACKEAMSWPEDITIAINLSPAQFKSKDVVQVVKHALASSGLPASRLELEITELVLLEESAGAFAILHQLRDLGIRIAMDDFGTGYSSLGYLRSFPFSTIKIDQSFIRDLPASEDSLAIIRAVVGLSSSLGMKTIAEGVETKEQFASLAAEGCTQSQGFLFSKPRPGNEVRKILSDQTSAADPTA